MRLAVKTFQLLSCAILCLALTTLAPSVGAATVKGKAAKKTPTPTANGSAAVAGGPAFRPEARLYQYSIEVQNAPHATYSDLEHYTLRLLAFLNANGLSSACVDIRRDLSPNAIMKNNLQLLLTAPIEPATYPQLQALLCEGIDGACKIDSNGPIVAEANQLQFSVVQNPHVFAHYEESREFRVPIVALTTPLAEFPLVTTSCESGNTGDSLMFSGRSNAIRALLKASGIPLETPTRQFGLTTSDGQRWWGFGHLDWAWTDHPTTKEDVELAPKSILDKLK